MDVHALTNRIYGYWSIAISIPVCGLWAQLQPICVMWWTVACTINHSRLILLKSLAEPSTQIWLDPDCTSHLNTMACPLRTMTHTNTPDSPLVSKLSVIQNTDYGLEKYSASCSHSQSFNLVWDAESGPWTILGPRWVSHALKVSSQSEYLAENSAARLGSFVQHNLQGRKPSNINPKMSSNFGVQQPADTSVSIVCCLCLNLLLDTNGHDLGFW